MCSISVYKNFAKFAGETLCHSLFLSKVSTLLKKDPGTDVYVLNFAKFEKTFFKKFCSFFRLSVKDISGIIDRIKGFVNYKMLFERNRERMNGQPVSVGSPWWIPQSVKVLALLST